MFNDRGSVAVRLAVADDARHGVAVMNKGIWLRHHPDGWGVNVLTPATADARAAGACFNDTRVDVEAASA